MRKRRIILNKHFTEPVEGYKVVEWLEEVTQAYDTGEIFDNTKDILTELRGMKVKRVDACLHLRGLLHLQVTLHLDEDDFPLIEWNSMGFCDGHETRVVQYEECDEDETIKEE